MAQVIEKIVRSKYPPRDTRVLWLDTKDDLLKSFTSNGWTKIFADTAINVLRNAGYLFAGIATPSADPGVPEAKVFYIANGKGTYTYFGNLEVTEDDVVILYYDTTWHKVATGIAPQKKLAKLERDLGMYPELEPLPLNSEVTGKYINSDGKYVDASGWNIASIGAVSLGNTYLLNMVSSANMVLGVALFVSRVYKRDKEGKIIGTILTPLFSAKNTSIPASGYVLFEAMDDYDEVLICYKPALTTQMLVARWGFKASHATQLRNLRLVVDNKTDFEGIYELLTAGYALNLVGKGNGEPQAFMSRKTGGGNITDGSAVIKEVDGVQPIVWNKLVKNGNFADGYKGWTAYNGTLSVDNNILTYTVTTSSNFEPSVFQSNFPDIVNHKYLFAAELNYSIKPANTQQGFLGIGGYYGTSWNIQDIVPNSWFKVAGIVTSTGDSTTKDLRIYLRTVGMSAGDTVKVKNVVALDLTQMFGAGNEPATYEEYLDRISHYHIADEYAYNAGEVVNYKGTGIKTTNVDGTKSYVRDWSEVMKKYFPDGMTSLNGVKDFFNERKAVRKYGVVDLGTLDWLYHNGVFHFADGYTFPTGKMKNKGEIAIGRYSYVGHIEPSSIKDKGISSHNYFSDSASILVKDSAYTTAESFKAAMAGVLLIYELSEPVEDIFEKPLNLTYTVINGGTETSLATENSTQFEGSIFYGKDYVGVIDELQLQNRVTQIEFENWEN